MANIKIHEIASKWVGDEPNKINKLCNNISLLEKK
jgi:hypothetical protein